MISKPAFVKANEERYWQKEKVAMAWLTVRDWLWWTLYCLSFPLWPAATKSCQTLSRPKCLHHCQLGPTTRKTPTAHPSALSHLQNIWILDLQTIRLRDENWRKKAFFQISNVDGQRPGWPGGRRSSRNPWSKSRPRYITSSIFLIELCKISWNILTALVLFVTERRLYTQPYISQPHLCLLHWSYPHPHLSLCQ